MPQWGVCARPHPKRSASGASDLGLDNERNQLYNFTAFLFWDMEKSYFWDVRKSSSLAVDFISCEYESALQLQTKP